MQFYVYAYFRPDGSPCYIGKGKGSRYKRHKDKRQNKHLAAIMDQAGGDLPVVIVRNGLTEVQAFEIEVALIATIGRECDGGPLINLTLGGEGGSGHKLSAETKEKMSAARRREWADPEMRAKILSSREGKNKGNRNPRTEEWKILVGGKLKGNQNSLGVVHSEETRAKMSASGKGRIQSPEHVAKRIVAHIGAKRPAITGERISAALRGRSISDDHKLKISEATRGIAKSAETRARMSEAQRQRWAAAC